MARVIKRSPQLIREIDVASEILQMVHSGSPTVFCWWIVSAYYEGAGQNLAETARILRVSLSSIKRYKKVVPGVKEFMDHPERWERVKAIADETPANGQGKPKQPKQPKRGGTTDKRKKTAVK